MFADTDAIRALGSANSAHADDLAAIAATLSSLPVATAGSPLGPVAARFLSALADAADPRVRGQSRIERSRCVEVQATAYATAAAYDEADHRRRRAHLGGLAVPSALVAALAAPIREVQSLVGPGWTGDPAGDPASCCAGARGAGELSAAEAGTPGTATNWRGSGADGAADFAARRSRPPTGAGETIGELRGRSTRVGRSRAGQRAVERIIDRFEARAHALEPYLDSPGVAEG